MNESNVAEPETSTEHQHDLNGMTGPGVAKPFIPEIINAAEAYVVARNRRMGLTQLEMEAKQRVMNLLHIHEELLGRTPEGTIRYEYDDKLIELTPTKEKLRVKSLREDEDE